MASALSPSTNGKWFAAVVEATGDNRKDFSSRRKSAPMSGLLFWLAFELAGMMAGLLKLNYFTAVEKRPCKEFTLQQFT
jgi:hypothetical protein